MPPPRASARRALARGPAAADGDLPLIVQLRNNDNGLCFESTFLSPLRNTPTPLKATAP